MLTNTFVIRSGKSKKILHSAATRLFYHSTSGGLQVFFSFCFFTEAPPIVVWKSREVCLTAGSNSLSLAFYGDFLS